MRSSHTTVQGKAKCLAYRNGKRCGRVATVVGRCKRNVWHEAAMCKECSDRLGAEAMIESAHGFHVRTLSLNSVVSRHYVPVVEV
jgi:hypothetical protein